MTAKASDSGKRHDILADQAGQRIIVGPLRRSEPPNANEIREGHRETSPTRGMTSISSRKPAA